MPPKDEGQAKGPSGYGSSPHMKIVAVSILVMGISLAVVIVLYIWFGHIGPTFSSTRLLEQQAQLRDQYGLPPQPPVPKNLLEVPPSLRGITPASGNETSTSSTGTNSSSTNATSTSSQPSATNATTTASAANSTTTNTTAASTNATTSNSSNNTGNNNTNKTR